jgi:DNA-binding CsgD family transcriptional regulator
MNADFTTNLKANHPNLTVSEIEPCSLLKLNLSKKDIAKILKIEHVSVIKKKQRMKNKLEIMSLINLEYL